jgi:hypothetical protein
MTKQEEITPSSEQRAWRYIETPLAAEVEAGNIRLRPHWKGAIDAKEIRKVVRLAARAPELLVFLAKIYLDYEDDCGCGCDNENCCAVVGERCAKCHARIAIALALVDGPQETNK